MANLDGTLPALQSAYQQLTAYANALGIGFTVAPYGGFRTAADTTQILDYRQQDFNAAVAAGTIAPDTTLQAFRPIAPYGSSFHDFGAAFDVQITAKPSSMTTDQAFAALGAVAPQFGLRWGGTFTNPDTDHFELAESLADAAQDYNDMIASGGGTSSTSSGLTSLPVLAGIVGAGIVVYVLIRRFA